MFNLCAKNFARFSTSHCEKPDFCFARFTRSTFRFVVALFSSSHSQSNRFRVFSNIASPIAASRFLSTLIIVRVLFFLLFAFTREAFDTEKHLGSFVRQKNYSQSPFFRSSAASDFSAAHCSTVEAREEFNLRRHQSIDACVPARGE